MDGRIAVFVDGGYIDRICMDEFEGVRINLEKLSIAMAGNIQLLRTYYYHCLPYQSQPPSEEEKQRFANKQKFFNALERISRFNVRLGKLKYRGQNQAGEPVFEQKGVDALLAVDLVQLASKHIITHAAIATADNDFVPVIEAAKNEGVLVTLYHSRTLGKHQDLWMCADERRVIDNAFVNNVARERQIL
jgi:uncharacterized LabA/DUF88 family protein